MKNKVIIVLLAIGLVTMGLWAQDAEQTDTETAETLDLEQADASRIGADSADRRLKEVSVEKFEVEGTWNTSMSYDEGIIQGRLFDGNPANKEAIPEEEGMEIPDDKVFGVKVSYYRRGHNSFEVRPVKAIPIEGIAKTVSVWVVGRSYPHELYLLIEDFFGHQFELYMGKLNHSGWKRMSVAIPPQKPDGKSGIIQRDYHYGQNMGLKIRGFRINCDPEEAYGNYYIYFDDMRSVTDLYEMHFRDKDDMSDNW